ncbi:MAG: TonB-dependent receptor [Flavobacteriales bacterium]|nr:TonB-dependent receptor [Flavobacteriales bacterium]
MQRILLFCILTLSILTVSAQQKFTVSGYVKDAANGEGLPGANVFVKENLTGVTTNTYGFYSLTLPAGNYTLVSSFISFKSFSQSIELNKNITLNIELQKADQDIKEVIISDDKSREKIESSQMSSITLTIEEIKKLPAFMGEVDILKTITLLPGVQSSGEGNTGFYVRGGGPDQNLILLDGAPVYNASHLFGFFSVFNGDAIKSVELIKGGMPAQYGGRLSSVLDISMKEGNNKKYEVDGGLGLIASRLTVQGPIVKNKVSFIVSGRRTYADLLVKPFTRKGSPLRNSGYYFYDVNAKINWIVGPKDRIFLSGYFGRDKFSFRNQEGSFNAGIAWGNATATLRWNHLFSSKLFSNVTLIFTDYNFGFDGSQSEFNFRLGTGVRDYGVKMDINYYPTPKHTVRIGAEYTNHRYTPSNITFAGSIGDILPPEPIRMHTNEAAIYIGDDWEINKIFRINAGVRASYFAFTGPFTRYEKNENGQTVDTTVYNPWQKIADYFRAEPRFSFRAKAHENIAIKASYTQNYQYTQLVSRATVSLPLDVWLPSTDLTKPQFSQQVAVGYFHNFLNGMVEASVEGYYKDMRNLVEFADGSDPAQAINDNIDHTLVQGRGESYGMELFVKKAKGKWQGWVGYTLAWTNRIFPELNNGNIFPAKYDRRHDLSIVATYDLNYRWQFGGIFVYASGNTLTMPSQLYFYQNELVTEFGDRNAYRFPAYHRLDLSVTYVTSKPEKKFKSSLTMSVYNVYSRQNPYFIYYDREGNLADGTFQLKAKQVSLFPVIPALTWNFKY